MAYSDTFRMQVVAEYENGSSATSLMRKYGITGKATISKWAKKYGTKTLCNVPLDREPLSERAKKVALIKELEEAKLRIAALEALLDAASKHTGVDFKKNFGGK